MNRKRFTWILASLASLTMAFAIFAAIAGTWRGAALEFVQPRMASVQAARLPAEVQAEPVRIAAVDLWPVRDSGQIRIAQAGDGGAEMSEDELISRGEEVYMENCAMCHQPNGQGAGGYPALAGNSFVTADDPSGPIEVVMEGRGAMPSFGGQLPDEDIAAVVSYIRNSWENQAPVVQVSDVTGEQPQQEGAAQEEAQQQEEQPADQQQQQEQPAQQEPSADDQSQDTQQQDAQASEQMTSTAAAGSPTPIRIEIQVVLATPTAAGQQAEPAASDTEQAAQQATPTPASDQPSEEAAVEDTAEDAEADTEADTEEEDTGADAEQTLADRQEQAAQEAQEATATPAPTTEQATTDQATEDAATESETSDEAAEDETSADETGAEEATTDQATSEQQATDQQATETTTSTTTSVPQIGSAVTPTGTLPGEPAIQVVKVVEGLVDPINVAYAPDGSGRVFIVERIGRIRILQDGQLLDEPFLDISDVVKVDFLEQGLLGLAFHPDYANNGRFFVYYSDYFTNGDSFLVEYQVSDDPNVADPDSAKVLLTYDQPYRNHNGGKVAFGPDGYLYWASGDGGLAGDSLRNAQDLENLLGKLLRIDVDTDHRDGYTIPDDNPFMGQVIPPSEGNEEAQDGDYVPDARPEIWAYGLRNPWQFSFDRETGDLYIADVGQAGWEEINVQPADSEGGINYGWPILEGSHCFLDENCGTFGELPVAEYANPDEGCSITGIGIYRGEEFPSLDGIYFTADYCSGRFWGLMRGEGDEWHFSELLHTSLVITGAGEDEAGNLYVTTCTCQFGRDYNPYEESNGMIWRIVAQDQVPEGAETAPLRE